MSEWTPERLALERLWRMPTDWRIGCECPVEPDAAPPAESFMHRHVCGACLRTWICEAMICVAA